MKDYYNFEDRINILRNFNADFKHSAWHNDKVIDLDEFIKGKGFLDVQNFHFEYDVNPSKIIGSSHCNYYSGSWIQMLENLKRFHRLPQFYPNSVEEYVNQQDNINLIKCGDNYFISEGNHRFCIAKFLEMKIKRVEVNEFLLYENIRIT